VYVDHWLHGNSERDEHAESTEVIRNDRRDCEQGADLEHALPQWHPTFEMPKDYVRDSKQHRDDCQMKEQPAILTTIAGMLAKPSQAVITTAA